MEGGAGAAQTAPAAGAGPGSTANGGTTAAAVSRAPVVAGATPAGPPAGPAGAPPMPGLGPAASQAEVEKAAREAFAKQYAATMQRLTAASNGGGGGGGGGQPSVAQGGAQSGQIDPMTLYYLQQQQQQQQLALAMQQQGMGGQPQRQETPPAPGLVPAPGAGRVTAAPSAGTQAVSAAPQPLLGRSRAARTGSNVRREPQRNQFADEQKFSEAWTAWRKARDSNNAAVKKCRNKTMKRKAGPQKAQAHSVPKMLHDIEVLLSVFDELGPLDNQLLEGKVVNIRKSYRLV